MIRDHQEWLGYLQPDGLVVSPLALVDAQVILDTRAIETQQRFLPFAQTVTSGTATKTSRLSPTSLRFVATSWHGRRTAYGVWMRNIRCRTI